MKFRPLSLFVGLAAIIPAVSLSAAEPLADLLRERLASVVAVEITVALEIDRSVDTVNGIVVDREGTVILESGAINDRLTPDQLVEIRVYRADAPATDYATAEYLGRDIYTGWHFVRIAPEGRTGLRPITDFAGPNPPAEPGLADPLWGIGLRKKDEDFRPYFLMSRVSMVQPLPQLMAIMLEDTAGRGLPAFDLDGNFVGIGTSGFGESMLVYSGRSRGPVPSLFVNPEESSALRLAADVLPYLHRIPDDVYGRPLPWFGIDGIQPLDPEVAAYLGLDNGVGLVISDVLAQSPAEAGGLLPRDIIVELGSVPLPRLKPENVVTVFLQREIARQRPGDVLSVTVLRDGNRLELPITIGEAPKTPKEAERQYFEDLGLTIREFVYNDANDRRSDPTQLTGVVAHFVNSSSPVGVAGLQYDDWIQQIDGEPVTSFAQAVLLLEAVKSSGRPEVVLLVKRGGETSVLRVRLNGTGPTG